MVKHTIEFTLPEDEEALYHAKHGALYREVLRAVDEHLRTQIKYHNFRKTTITALQSVRETLYTECRERDLHLDD